MRSVKKLLMMAALCGVCLQTATAALAQQAQKPAVVVSLASLDETMKDLNYLGEAAGAQQFVALAQLMSGPYRQSLDTTKPIGMTMTFQGQMPVFTGFIPVKNLQQLLGTLAQQIGPAQDAGGGIKQLTGPGGQSLFIKENQGYAFVANTKELLNTVPADPAGLLAGADKKYNIAVTVNMPSIPQNLRQMAIAQIRQGVEQQMQNQSFEDETQRVLQERLSRNSLEQITKLLEQADTATLGWAIDAQSKSTYLDVTLTALAGTEFAQQMESLEGLKTNFAGFGMPAAVNAMFTVEMQPADKDQATFMLTTLSDKAKEQIDSDADLTPEARAAAKEVLDSFINVMTATVNEGRLDGGAVLTVQNERLQFAGGLHVADGQQFDTAFKRLVELAREEEEFPEVQLGAVKHKNVVFHTMSVPLPDEAARKTFGETLQAAVGVGPKSVYLAFGEGSMDLVKQVIDQSAQQGATATVPSKLIVSLTPLVRFSSQFQQGNQNFAAMLAALDQAQGKDHVSLVGQPIERGFNYRIEIEEGVLRMIGAAVVANMQQGQP